MDICVLTEKAFAHGGLFVRAQPIGGLRMIDGEQADDKIIAVLESDLAYGQIKNINDCPKALVDRLTHYFLSYKQFPGEPQRRVEIAEVYDRAEAGEVIERSLRDYQAKFGDPEQRIPQLRKLISSEE
jgi:inorganic pyrophosphatase